MRLISSCLLLACSGALLAQSVYLPDPSRTPGVRNPAVTQSTIGSTICKSGWTKTIRPPVSYTNKLKAQEMAELGLKGAPSDYELDHFISLEMGGDPKDPKNLWPEIWPQARLKDVVETNLAHRVCKGTITLAEAQKIISTDWTSEYQRIKGKTVAQALKAK
jgi:hypothetical protein